MDVKSFLEILTFVSSIAAVVVVGKSNIKKQVISDLQALVAAHEQTINQLRKDSADKDERIATLEDTIDGYSELVREGYLAGGSGPRGRNSTASSKTTKNRAA